MAGSPVSYVLLPSAARTATNSSAKYPGAGADTLKVMVDVTAIVDTPSVVFTIEAYNPVADTWTAVLASAAVVGTGGTSLQVGPELIDAANASENAPVPFTWRVTATHADADSITYSVYAELNT